MPAQVMKFGPVPVSDAVGAILAHSVSLPNGKLKKGITLEAAHIAALKAAGLREVTVARMQAGDVHEDDAARRLASALVPDPKSSGLIVQAPHTGRVNILAADAGLARIDAAAIHAVNAVYPMITVATVPEWQRMTARGMVATVKVISYAVPHVALEQAEHAAKGALALTRPVGLKTALVQTVVGDDDGTRGHAAIQDRVAALNSAYLPKTVVAHDISVLADALLASPADVLLILTGSATSDLHDVAPQAVRAAGGTVAHYGMPVDPGNLLFIGDLDGKPVIGLPGCARSPALNGADWVLERVLCGVPVTPDDIMRMGVGGLLKEIPTRPQPRRKTV